ncbi:MAG: hypothetical protein QME96_13855 [Myxococcota bacterium]|nr:hypothetical protein [Myxococcota bacterium]
MISVLLVALIVAGWSALALRRRQGLATAREGAAVAAYLVLAVLQAIFQDQVQFDDYFFAPVYLAIPVWLGVAGGANQAFIGTVLGGGALFAVSAMAPFDGFVVDPGSDLPIAQQFLAVGVLAAIGVLAAALRHRPWLAGLCVLPPWALFVRIVHPDLLRSFSPWIVMTLAAAAATAGLLLREIGLVARSVSWMRICTSADAAAADGDR